MTRRSFFNWLVGIPVCSALIKPDESPTETIQERSQRQQLFLQLHDKQLISTRTLLREFGIDADHEFKMLLKESAA